MNSKVIQGNNIDILKTYPDNHFDSIVTDPPYGIEFLGKDWDSNTGAVETWAECYRVLKPGGYLLAFSAARTYHNLATNIEGVGFEIRDQLMWLYASGFPKAQDIGKAIDKRAGKDKQYTYHKHKHADTRAVKNSVNHTTLYCIECDANMTYPPSQCDRLCNAKSPPIESEWAGWKTALKPAHEPIVMARKPFKGSCVDNVLNHGVGALNIDATRIEYECDYDAKHQADISRGQQNAKNGTNFFGSGKSVSDDKGQGRFPSNVIGEIEGYQKFFYCPKVSRAERHIGFEAPEPEPFNNPEDMKKHPLWDPSIGTNSHRLMTKIREHQKNNTKGIYTTGDAMRELGGRWENQKTAAGIKAVAVDKDGNTIPQITLQTMVESKASGNNHPTVKPVALMKYLVKLVTPAGGKVLDPFTGSGSTGMAAVELDYDFTGCELDPDYVNIAETRITAWKNKTDLENNPLPEEWFDE